MYGLLSKNFKSHIDVLISLMIKNIEETIKHIFMLKLPIIEIERTRIIEIIEDSGFNYTERKTP